MNRDKKKTAKATGSKTPSDYQSSKTPEVKATAFNKKTKDNA
ncbi:hypothetical protein [Pedobacter yulinensis]|nr:hypothetical protein [Pedobacter yulinensis]